MTQDWAMKFLPVKYREAQSDWYGKRGISWHVSVVARKMNGRFESQSFFHIVENISHDTSAVVRITVHTLRSLKEENPIIGIASLRQDNAGCYHSSAMIASCALMKQIPRSLSAEWISVTHRGVKGPATERRPLSKPTYAGT